MNFVKRTVCGDELFCAYDYIAVGLSLHMWLLSYGTPSSCYEIALQKFRKIYRDGLMKISCSFLAFNTLKYINTSDQCTSSSKSGTTYQADSWISRLYLDNWWCGECEHRWNPLLLLLAIWKSLYSYKTFYNSKLWYMFHPCSSKPKHKTVFHESTETYLK